VTINRKHIQVNANKFNSLNLSSALRSAMEAPRLKGKIGSLKALIATDVPGDLTRESHSDLMKAAMVGPPETFLELWSGVDLNSRAVWCSESSSELKQKYIVDHPNQARKMQNVILGGRYLLFRRVEQHCIWQPPMGRLRLCVTYVGCQE